MPLIVVAVLLSIVPVGWASAPPPPRAALSGYVRDLESGAPVPGARVVAGSVSVVADEQGAIPPTMIPLSGPLQELDIVVTAPSYAAWTFERFVFRAGVSVELRARLRSEQAPPEPAAGPAEPAPRPQPPEPSSAASTSLPPEYITIGRAADYYGTTNCVVPHPAEPIPVEVLPFQDYVRNVLPNEWIASWPAASLDAGAIAAKQFAWYTAFVEGKWSRQGYRFDLLDNTCDQVYRPGRATEATDAAIMRTWLTSLTRNGRLFPTYYRAYERQCPFVPGCMGQHETARMAEQGWSAHQILQYYYYPADYNIVRLDPRAYIPLSIR